MEAAATEYKVRKRSSNNFKIKNEVQRFAKTVLQKKNKRKEVCVLKKEENDHDFLYFIIFHYFFCYLCKMMNIELLMRLNISSSKN